MKTLREVAREAGVSAATVSRTFTSPDLLSTETRDRVLQAAARLDYRPRRSVSHRANQRLFRGSESAAHTGTSIGLQFFGATPQDSLAANAFYAHVLAGAEAEATELGWHMMVHSTDRHSLERSLPRMIEEKAVSGLLLVGAADPEILRVFIDAVPTLVVVDHRDPTGEHDCIVSDGFSGTYQVVEHLHSFGHRRIAFLTDDSGSTSFQDRERGYICACHEAGCTIERSHIVRVKEMDDIPARLRALMALPKPPTALIAVNDRYAGEVIQTCRAEGISIPGELSLAGFDDVSFAAHTWPPLTTVRVPKEEIGRVAIRRLHERLDQTDGRAKPLAPVTIQVPVSLVVRESCTYPPDHPESKSRRV